MNTVSGCSSSSPIYDITLDQLPTPSILPDPAETCPGTGLSLNGNPSGGSGVYSTHLWSGAGVGSLSATNIVNPIFTNLTSGNYALTYTVTDNRGCIGSDNITVSVDPTATADDDQELCGTNIASLLGNLPLVGTGTWTKQSGPGTVTFSNQNLYNSTATVSLYGTYVLRWTIQNASCNTLDEVTIDFNENPDGLLAGSNDIAVCDALSYTLAGTGHSYQALSDHTGSTRIWSYVSGPDATPTFADATDPHSLVTVDLYGSYVFQWTETNGNCSQSAQVTIDFNENPDGLLAGSNDIAVCDALSYTLAGTGHSYQALSDHTGSTRIWSYVSGPDATPTFADATDPHSLVTVDLYGSYVFQWTETNGNCSQSAQVTIDFNENPDGLLAGSNDIAVCDALSYTLAGTGHSYQALSDHTGSTRIWSYVSGPDATPTFADATDPHSLVTVDLYGSYVFQWTETNGNCSQSAQVTIDFNENPDGLLAGSNDIAVCDALSYTLAGTGHSYQALSDHTGSTRIWSYVSGPDATPTFADATDPHSLVTVDLYGSYVFQWTETNGNCSQSAQVTIDFNENPDGLLAGSNDIAVCDALSYTLAGTGHSYQALSDHTGSTRIWSYVSGPDATPTFADATDPHSLVTVDLYGSYVFQWTETNGNCSQSAQVTIDFNENPDGLLAGSNDIAVCDALSYTLAGTGHSYQALSDHTGSTRIWSYVSGPDATPTFADATDPHSLVTVDLYGSYVFQWTETNGNCSQSAQVTIDFNENPDGLLAGSNDIAVCDALSYTLAGTGHSYQALSDHTGSTRIWSYVSGPDATPTFADATDPHSLVTVDLYGSYVFQWTETNGNCSQSAQVTIDFNENPDGLLAGSNDIAVCDALSYTLAGTGHSYQALSDHTGSTRIWSYVSGPDATPTFADATDPHSLVTVDLYGSYVFQWTETNGNCSQSAQVTIDFNENPDGLLAGTDDIAVCDALSYTLAGTGHTYQALSDHTGSTRLWSYVSGPDATPTFADATDPHSLVTVDLYGSYVFRWTETNGNCTQSAEVTIDFNENPDGLLAGTDDIAVCDALSYTLAGTGHTYQALSDHTGSTRLWSYVSGPDATPTFADATDPHSLVTVDLYGSYVFRWTETNGNCTQSAEVTIDFNENPDGLLAGTDDIAVCDALSYTLAGTGHSTRL